MFDDLLFKNLSRFKIFIGDIILHNLIEFRIWGRVKKVENISSMQEILRILYWRFYGFCDEYIFDTKCHAMNISQNILSLFWDVSYDFDRVEDFWIWGRVKVHNISLMQEISRVLYEDFWIWSRMKVQNISLM